MIFFSKESKWKITLRLPHVWAKGWLNEIMPTRVSPRNACHRNSPFLANGADPRLNFEERRALIQPQPGTISTSTILEF
jgi:hypothetical protein